MSLRPVPQPEGFDLRAARAARGDCKDWLPEDALFSASELLKEFPAEGAFIVAWYHRDPDEHHALKFRVFQQHDFQAKGLVAELFSWLTAP